MNKSKDVADRCLVGECEVVGTTRNDLGEKYLIIYDYKNCNVQHILLPWREAECDELLKMFGMPTDY